nr:hypothetical protein [Tanacetum cinerariifolium]
MHIDIMAASSKEHPPMLAPGRYAQWQSRFLIHVDTKSNKKELKQCIFDGPYVMFEVTIRAKPATSTKQAVHEHNVLETYRTPLPKNVLIGAEAEIIHMILSGIGNVIYSTVNACITAKEMWIAIERLQQGESLNKQDVKTNLFREFGVFGFADIQFCKSIQRVLFHSIRHEYMSRTHADHGVGVIKPRIKDDISFGIKSHILKGIRETSFGVTKEEDTNEHVWKVLENFEMFNLLKVSKDQIMLTIFPKTLIGAARRCIKSESKGVATITTKIDNLGHKVTKVNERVNAFQVGCDVYQVCHLSKDFPLKDEAQIEKVKYGEFRG